MKKILLRLGLAALLSPAFADWTEFRGPASDGITAAEVPLKWGKDQNVTWRKEIHGLGWSTPLVMEGKIWITTASEKGHQMSILCLDEKSGGVLLDRVFITSDNPEPLANNLNTYASPTGVIEAGRAWFSFGSYGTICLDTKTFESVWERRDLTCSHWRGPASSLAKWENTIVLTMEGADQQYFTALDKNTGETLWRRDRGTVYSDEKDGIPANSGDMRKAYSTPIFVPVGETVQMICNGAKACAAYDVKTGEEIWHVPYETHSPSSRCVYNQESGMVYINTGLGKAEIWAIRLEPGMKGNVKDSHVVWSFFQRTPKRSSPARISSVTWLGTACISAVPESRSVGASSTRSVASTSRWSACRTASSCSELPNRADAPARAR